MPDYNDECDKQVGKLANWELKKPIEPKFLQVDRRIKETEAEIEALTQLLDSKKNYLKQLQSVRKMVTPADEAKIRALVSVGLL